MADPYDEIEARIQTLIQALTRFAGNTGRVTRGNYKILDTGVPEAVILDMGAVGPETQEAYGVYRDFDVLVTILTKYGADEATMHTNFKALRYDIIALEEKYPSLNNLGGVIQTAIQSDGDPDDVYDKLGAGPFFRMQSLRWTVTRRYAVSGGEY